MATGTLTRKGMEMTTICNSKFTVKPLAAAVAVALMAPALAFAEPLFQVPLYRGADMTRYTTNYIELGAGVTTEDSFKFGNFTGLPDKGGFLIGNFNLGNRTPATGMFWNVSGFDLGTDSRQAAATFGTQGLWTLNAGFAQVTNHITDSARFIHTGLGTNTLDLPAGFPGITAGASQPPANIAAINPFLRPFDVKTERDFLRVGGTFNFAPGWGLSANYRHDTRDGTRLTGAVMGNSGGNPRSVVVPYPIDDTTREVETAVHYTGNVFQFKLSYLYSKYENDETALTWRNPYGTIAGWAAGTGFPTGYGRMGLMPTNDFNQIMATGGYSISPVTRVNATFSYGVARQNESFLPYTVNVAPVLVPGLNVPVALPAGSLDGKIVNTLFDVTGLTKFANVGLRANYHYLHQDNRTPMRQWNYVGGDTTDQVVIPVGLTPDQVASPRIRTNLAPGHEENRFRLEGDYPLARGTKLRAYYQYQKIDYEEAVDEFRANTDTNTFGAEVRSRFTPNVNGYLKYQFDRRRGSEWDPNRPYRASYTPAQVAVVPSDNLSTLRQFYMADYDQNTVKAAVNFTPSEMVGVQLLGQWHSRDYKGPDCGQAADQVYLALPVPYVVPGDCLGRTEAAGQNFTIDTQFTPAEAISFFAFYTYSQLSTDQASRSWGGANLANNVNRNWWASLESTDHTVGLGANWRPAGRPYDVGLQYIYNRGTTNTDLTPGPALAAPTAFLPVPDVVNKLNQVQLYGTWQWSKTVKLRANYVYQTFKSNDWHYQNVLPWTSQNVLLTGQTPGSYHNNIFGLSVAITLW
jgi:MtrB/PioB family decaheme-associated outer membrane protein